LGKDITSARLELEKYNFDIIVYPDLGMKLLPTLLAYSRISNIQITTWGHSETSGIDTIDYYISSEWFAKNIVLEGNYYSEKLILMKSLSTYYVSPHKLFISSNKDFMGKTFKTRLELGFKKDDHLYCCLQTFYKFNEDFEIALGKIIELDPKSIILLSNTFPFCKSHLLRLRKRLGEEKLLHLRWYNSLEKVDFLNIVSICDVCLDPFPFGGCNTSYDAFDYHIPVITYPSEYLHGRFTYGLYSKMGLEHCECIARDNDEYAKLAVEIGINEKLKHKMQRNIEMNKYKIFQEDGSVNEWNSVLLGFEKLYC
jgi:predicted O-linked N-acetylglucosamine transferase (SPINDLY family)